MGRDEMAGVVSVQDSSRSESPGDGSEHDRLVLRLLAVRTARLLCLSDGVQGHSPIDQLRRFGLGVTGAQDVTRARQKLNEEIFDLVVVAGGQAEEMALPLLGEFSKSQAIVVLARNPTDLTLGSLFLAGAFDVWNASSLTTSRLEILIASALRKRQGAVSPLRQFGPVTVCFDRHCIAFDTKDGKQSLHLTSTEFRLLMVLLDGNGRVHGRAEILEQVWGKDLHVHQRTVDRHIAALRQKLRMSPLQIESVHGFGYRCGVQVS